MRSNEVVLAGELSGIEPLRYTPAGVPLAGFRLLHRSRQVEGGVERQVECEVNGVALAEVALRLAQWKVGQRIEVRGFLNRRNRTSAQLVLHATGVEHLETKHGDGTVRQVQVER